MLVKNSIFVVAGQLASKALIFLTALLVAQLLGVEGFGDYSFAHATILTLDAFCVLGLSTAVARSIAVRHDANGDEVRVASAAMRLVISVGLICSVLLATFLAILPFAGISVGQQVTLSISLFATLPLAMSGVVVGVLVGKQLFGRLFFAQTIGAGSALVCIVGGAHLGGVNGAAYGLAISAYVSFACLFAVIPQRASIIRCTAFANRSLRLFRNELLETALPVFASGIAVTAAMWVGNFLLITQRDGSQNAGLWSASIHFIAILTFVPTAINSALFPRLAIAGNETPHLAKTIFLQTFGKTMAISSPIFLAALIFSPLFARLYGPTFAGIEELFRIAVLCAIAISIHSAMSNVLTAINKAWLHAVTNIAWSIAFLLLAAMSSTLSGNAIGMMLALTISHVLKVYCVWITLDRALSKPMKATNSIEANHEH